MIVSIEIDDYVAEKFDNQNKYCVFYSNLVYFILNYLVVVIVIF